MVELYRVENCVCKGKEKVNTERAPSGHQHERRQPLAAAGEFAPRYMTQGGELQDRVGSIYLRPFSALSLQGFSLPSATPFSFPLFPPGGALSVVCARMGLGGGGRKGERGGKRF